MQIDAVIRKTNRFGKLSQTWLQPGTTRHTATRGLTLTCGQTQTQRPINPGRSHRVYTGTPVYRFGDGGHRTQRLIMWSQQSRAHCVETEQSCFGTRLDCECAAHRQCFKHHHRHIINTHVDHQGDAVVLLFAQPPTVGAAGIPLRELVGFYRVTTGTRRITAGDVRKYAAPFGRHCERRHLFSSCGRVAVLSPSLSTTARVLQPA